jgi:FAD/FMN-containing dehydrogenase
MPRIDIPYRLKTLTFATSHRSTFQRDVTPQCFVQPTCADEVAAILVLAERTNCSFAVRSGGHAAYTGASNIPDGITIDLRGLDELAVSEDRTLTRVGPGNHWIDVYDYLGPKNLSVVGGRVSGIGVGGLTLGGGISWFSMRHGWACDGVRNYVCLPVHSSLFHVRPSS